MSQQIDTKQLFSLLVAQLSASAWTQLGITPNPVTNRKDKNLDAAQMTIGILETLLFKTAGNLTKQEDEQLATSVRELKRHLLQENNIHPGK